MNDIQHNNSYIFSNPTLHYFFHFIISLCFNKKKILTLLLYYY